MTLRQTVAAMGSARSSAKRCTKPAGHASLRFKKLRLLPVLLAILVTVSACPLSLVPGDESLEAAYQAAIADAAVAEPDEICRSLTPVVDYNTDLMWMDEGGEKRVLMVTWTGWTGYDEAVGEDMTLAIDVWVTAAPEVQDFCRSHCVAPSMLSLRLEQLLGLPPNDGKTRFVELWVDPGDLFRPSPDPEITDCEAELDFPASDQFVTVDPAYKQWFNDQAAVSYGEDGYPWTRLGYTYDWGNPFSEVGLSEFVIREGAHVTVRAVESTEEYCRWWN